MCTLGCVLSSVLGFLVVPPPPQAVGAALPFSVLRSHPHVEGTSPMSASILFPGAAQRLEDTVSIDTTTVVLADAERSDWAVKLFGQVDLDAVATAAIPVALVAVLFLFFRLLKLFASAF